MKNQNELLKCFNTSFMEFSLCTNSDSEESDIFKEDLTNSSSNFNQKNNFFHKEEKNLIDLEKSPVNIEGLIYQKILGNGQCFYNAVGLYIGQDSEYLRKIVSANIEHNSKKYESHYIAPTEGKSWADYLKGVRDGKEWADNIEIQVLMELLDRSIRLVLIF